MKHYFNVELRGFFVEGKSLIPEGSTPLSEEYYDALMAGISEGKYLHVGPDGVPFLSDLSDMPKSSAILNKGRDITAWRDAEENAKLTFTSESFPGRTWDLDVVSKARMDYAYEAAKVGALPAGFFWTDASNSDVPMSNEELIQLRVDLGIALVQRGFMIHARQRQMKAEISALPSAEDVQRYVVGWPE